jgi:hypothetical protein
MDTILSGYQQHFTSGYYYSYQLESFAHYYQQHQSQMLYWKSLFPERIFTISYEQLVSDQETTLKKVFKFCDLDWDPACLESIQTNTTVVTASSMQVRNAIHKKSVERWRPYRDYLAPAANILSV